MILGKTAILERPSSENSAKFEQYFFYTARSSALLPNLNLEYQIKQTNKQTNTNSVAVLRERIILT
jgi:hypothetical protein